MVDSVDAGGWRRPDQLHKITRFSENQGTPLLVIANKQDLPGRWMLGDREDSWPGRAESSTTRTTSSRPAPSWERGLDEGHVRRKL
ncbi:ADP-ribosylation factor-like protein 4C [Lates japonicus]|uniref:ADP-ribosylation factor-like protein 4C n=1 Tax=Lates japonicus TaxID=270547 RepID=A0AAD3N0Z7_LATJO|nr:ADP-ribosylation factor-like protein 4C [Lates japonicus]